MAEKKSAGSKSDASVKPKKKISLIKKSDLAKSKAEKVAKKKVVKTTKAVEVQKISKKTPAPSKVKVVVKKEVKVAEKAVPVKVAEKAVPVKVAEKVVPVKVVPSKVVKAGKTGLSHSPRKPVQDISKMMENQAAEEVVVKKLAGEKKGDGVKSAGVVKAQKSVRVLDLSLPAGSKSSGKVAKEEEELTAPPKENPHSETFIKKQKERLEDLYDEILRVINGTAREVIRNAPEGSEASGSGQHQGDAGSDAYDREFALSMLAKEQDSLYEIEQALYRIKKGIYGICEISYKKIPQPRLEALPFTRLTIECQQQWEKENGNRRFRPSKEVGFSGGNYAEDDDSDTVSLDEDDE